MGDPQLEAMFNPEELLNAPPVSFLPFLHQLIVFEGGDNLPELLTVIGRDKLKDFLLNFEGTTFTVPSWDSIVLMLKDAYLIWRISEMNPLNQYKTQKELERIYGMKWSAIKARAEAIQSTLRRDD